MDNDTTAAESGRTAGAGMINRVIGGRYEILETIGEGPLLAAYRARDRALNRIVAVKTVRPGPAAQSEVAGRLRAGLAQVLSLNHVGITRVYDVGMDEASRSLFLAEEYVRGIDLGERIRRVAPFSLTAATDVALALAEALEYAHARGVVHGDVRPQNVLIGPEGHIKLTGFGTAGAQALLSDPETLRRTIPYAAPEVAQGGVPAVSGDLYALGVLLFEMLTGDLPYSGDSPIQIALRHAQDPVPSPRAINSGIPNALEGTVRKALAKRKEERYASASEMLADLRAIQDALRYGKSLSWSPLTRTGGDALPGSVAGERGRDDAEATIIMPTGAGKRAATNAPRRAAAPAENPPAREGRWLTSLNLFLAVLLLLGAAAFGYMTLSFLRTADDVIVPNLVGRTVLEAEAIAAQKKFTLSTIDERFMDKIPENTIYRMEPEPGRHIRENKPVKIWVSRGPKLVEVPDVRDMSIEGAKRKLEARGLRLGQRRYEFDPLAAKGNVLSQLPDAGENKPRGTSVDLVLSKGEEPAPELAIPDDIEATPAPRIPDNAGTGDDQRVRVFRVDYTIPSDGVRHRIRIDVTDKTGTRTVYDEDRGEGERVKEDVEGIGDRVIIKLFDNDELMAEQKK